MAHKKTLSSLLPFLFSAVSSNSALKSPLSLSLTLTIAAAMICSTTLVIAARARKKPHPCR